MTVKVYKKRTRWYYQFHNVEYQLDNSRFINILEKLFDSNVLYFKLKFVEQGDNMYLIPTWWKANTYRTNGIIKLFVRLFDREFMEDTFTFNFPIINTYGTKLRINIENVWARK